MKFDRAIARDPGGGDAKQTLGLMLTCSRQWFPKWAYVFDEDIDIYDDEQVKWAMSWRFNPQIDLVIIPQLNILPLDPMAQTNHPPVNTAKIGIDCTVPLVGDFDRFSFVKSTVSEPLSNVTETAPVLTEAELTQRMADFIRQQPRMWRDILAEFKDQPYPLVYRAFGNLRPKLGRVADCRPDYPYTFAETCFVYEHKTEVRKD